MEKNKELIFNRGARSVWGEMFRKCLQMLGYDDPITAKTGWIIEREAAILALRDICQDFGDNDWEENLNLADIIEKHLARHLYEKQ